ncbi:MAG: hypothetical protein LBV47_05355 [Bacteroidales bacterium]|jgi:hypothetical protein|nr:hypothetical protein [Bacteroidales bacterium]
MKKGLILLLYLIYSTNAFAQNEIGPDGDKLLIIFLLFIVSVSVFLLLNRLERRGKKKKPFFQFRRININLEKDRLYYPDTLTLTVKNTGNVDLDLDRPLLVFDNFWLKRKFKVKGMTNRTFYPLYLEKNKTHVLEIDINQFYTHDKRLKKFPKVKVSILDVKGRRLGGKSIFLRKTLLKF